MDGGARGVMRGNSCVMFSEPLGGIVGRSVTQERQPLQTVLYCGLGGGEEIAFFGRFLCIGGGVCMARVVINLEGRGQVRGLTD